MENLALTLINGINDKIELIAMVVIPFEIVLLMLMRKTLVLTEQFTNVVCGGLLWGMLFCIDPDLPQRLLERFQQYALFDIEWNFVTVVAHIFVGDFCFYVWHRLAHTKYIFMLEHNVHHSSTEFDYTTNMRVSFVTFFYSWTILVIPILLGFNLPLLIACLTLANAIPFFLHTEHIGKLGPLEWIFNTPSHHRVHHGKNPQYINKNFGGLFIIWDRLLGTYAEEQEKVVFGIHFDEGKKSPVAVLFRGWKQLFLILKPRIKLSVLDSKMNASPK